MSNWVSLYREVDTLTIVLWPLVKRHNWTYCDLMNQVRAVLVARRGDNDCTRAGSYPCEREQEFATYCTYVLGLRNTGEGTTAKDGRPAGHEVAARLCAALR